MMDGACGAVDGPQHGAPYDVGVLDETVGWEARHEACRASAPRVLRAPPQTYEDLDQSQAVEHEEWLARMSGRIGRSGATPASEVATALATELLAVSFPLDDLYGSPDLGNKVDPVDELVYIILSRRTREGAYQAAYDALRARYFDWAGLAMAPAEEIETTIAFSGLGRRKAQSLKLALGALIERFGSCTLEPTRAWDDEETRAFLCTLPEIGPKSAACVMMCSLDRPAFPVDAHVGRVLERLGIFRRVGIELAGRDHKVKQHLLWDAVPPAIRYPLHVNLVMHGRVTCIPRRPRCGDCVISRHCDYARAGGPSGGARV